MKLRSVSLGACGLLLGACAFGPTEGPVDQNGQEIVRGKTEKHLPQVVAVTVLGFGGSTLCSGTYIAPRVVLTAAHCLRGDAIPGQTFVYHGKDYVTDKASLPSIPAPGQRSKWARAETSTAHPGYDPAVNHPDVAILHLDRELPMAPLPLYRKHVSSWIKKGEIVGWGGSKALTADISVVEGSGVKRSGKVRIMGSPTEADFHADDPNPGILDPAIREDLLKTVGEAPRANGCAGDSGGPLLIEHHGKDYVAGVGFWVGLFCEDYSMFVRTESVLDFIDAEILAAGSKPIVPRLECVEENPDGSYVAHFGYTNENKVTVDVPYGFFRNFFPQDTEHNRPEAYAPGNNAFDFEVEGDDEMFWRFAPKSGPKTIIHVDESSPRCDPTDLGFLCDAQCDAAFASECFDGLSTRAQCMEFCQFNAQFFRDFGCGAEWDTALRCLGDVAPAAENWDCSFPGFPPFPLPPNCDAEQAAAFACVGF